MNGARLKKNPRKWEATTTWPSQDGAKPCSTWLHRMAQHRAHSTTDNLSPGSKADQSRVLSDYDIELLFKSGPHHRHKCSEQQAPSLNWAEHRAGLGHSEIGLIIFRNCLEIIDATTRMQRQAAAETDRWTSRWIKNQMQQVGEQRNGWATTRRDTQGDRWLDKSDRQVLTSCPYLCGTIQVTVSPKMSAW